MIGDRIKKERLLKDMTQQELSKLLDVSPSTIGMYEQNRRQPDSGTLIKLSQIFNVSTDYLLGKTNIKTSYDKTEPTPEEKYPDVTDVEEAMEILLNQPGLMLKGEVLEDDDKIILANAIQAGLRMADEIRKKRKERGKGDDENE